MQYFRKGPEKWVVEEIRPILPLRYLFFITHGRGERSR